MVATLGGEEERGGLQSKDAVIRFEHHTNLCQRYISRLFYSAARRDFDESARGRPSFSNVEVHVLMSDAIDEDSVEKSKVTVDFVCSIAAVMRSRGTKTPRESCKRNNSSRALTCKMSTRAPQWRP